MCCVCVCVWGDPDDDRWSIASGIGDETRPPRNRAVAALFDKTRARALFLVLRRRGRDMALIDPDNERIGSSPPSVLAVSNGHTLGSTTYKNIRFIAN